MRGRVVVVGAGVIGSHLLRLLARHPSVQGITIVDNDVYEEKNLASQEIQSSDIGRPKAIVQAQRLKQVRRDVQTSAIVDDVKNVPLGLLRSDMIFGCVDSNIARLYINQYAFRLGVPWVDSGVKSDALLARVHVYVPAEDAPCLECAWDERDYNSLEQSFPCAAARPAPTNAPAALGALAASLQALEFQKFVNGPSSGSSGRVAAGKQVIIDAMFQRHRVTEFKRNPNCRFDHRTWRVVGIDCLPQELTFGQAIEMGRSVTSKSEALSFRVEPGRFVTKLTCPPCGLDHDLLRLEKSLHGPRCPRCHQLMVVGPFGASDRIDTAVLPKKMLALTLRDVGVQPGDIYTVAGSSCESHFELPCEQEGGDR